MGVRWHLLLAVIITACILVVSACEVAGEKQLQEDVLIWTGEITGEFAHVLFDEQAQDLSLLADTDISVDLPTEEQFVLGGWIHLPIGWNPVP